MSCASRGPKGALNHLGLELQTAVSYHVGDGTRTLILWKNGRALSTPSALSFLNVEAKSQAWHRTRYLPTENVSAKKNPSHKQVSSQ